MSDLATFLLILAGMALAVPVAWLAGIFNPMGYLGVPPWRVPKQARAYCTEHAMRNCFCEKRRDA